jgi:dihydrofolate reductase
MNVIVAVNSDWGISYKGEQTAVIPEDRRYFREITDGGIVIMGRKTFESIGKPLPNRKNIVLTNNLNYKAKGVIIVHNMDQALSKIPNNSFHKVYIIGGAEVYNMFLPLCSHVYVTRFFVFDESDRYFPNLDQSPEWELIHVGETMESYNIMYTFELFRNRVM